MANDSGSKPGSVVDLRALVNEASVATERAGQRLRHAQHELSQVGDALVQLGEVTASLAPVAERLSEMTLDVARRMGPGAAGEPFVVLVRQLSEVTRQVAIALCDLDTHVRRSAVSLQKAITEAQQSTADLERIIPALRAANGTPPPLPGAPPPGEKIVALELKVNPAGGKAGAERRPPSILDVWPEEPAGRDDLKN